MKHPQTVTVYPEKNENKAAYLLWRSLRAALLTAGALIALMVIWNVDLKGLFVLPLGGAVTVLLGCIAGDYLGREHLVTTNRIQASKRVLSCTTAFVRLRAQATSEKAPAVGFRHFAEISTD